MGSHGCAAAQDPAIPGDFESWRGMTTYVQDQMTLSIMRRADSSVDFVQIRGDVDLSDSHALGLAARQLIEADDSVIYVDLGHTTFMGSTLVAFLVQVGSDAEGARRPLVLCRPTTMARKVIHMTGLDEVTCVRPDLPPLWPREIAD
ncbi:MAG: STAS domain-containing protein [Actinomycetes bacterium]